MRERPKTTETTIPLGIIVERRKARSAWAEDSWLPVSALPGKAQVEKWQCLQQDDETAQFFADTLSLVLHHKETDGYKMNLESSRPALYVVMRRADETDAPAPWQPHLITASAHEAQDYADSGEEIVEAIAIPPATAKLLQDFVATHHREQTFKKRKRDKVEIEVQRFGKEPIFNRRRHAGGEAG